MWLVYCCQLCTEFPNKVCMVMRVQACCRGGGTLSDTCSCMQGVHLPLGTATWSEPGHTYLRRIFAGLKNGIQFEIRVLLSVSKFSFGGRLRLVLVLKICVKVRSDLRFKLYSLNNIRLRVWLGCFSLFRKETGRWSREMYYACVPLHAAGTNIGKRVCCRRILRTNRVPTADYALKTTLADD